MRSIETLVRQYPSKSGLEILDIYEADKAKDKKDGEKRNKRKLDFIKDINENGGYYRGRFGETQYYYRKLTNLRFIENTICGDIEDIVCFNKFIDKTISIEKRVKVYEDIDRYGLQEDERITKEEYDKVSNYVTDIFPTFWKD